ncbi:MAG: TonB-dependent receptor [Magnetococcales bacterium]|nr:TonB-dependent receptor [Magnetococcales bacterium]NGZ26817.1 TonB-dependent receptor [Magnetococcales bacterium]
MSGLPKILLIAGLLALVPVVHADGNLPMDQKDNDILKKIPAEEMKQLNGKLRQAMTLYYDHAYSRAVNLFEEIAKAAPTMDMLYWLGSAAYRNKQSDLAISKFKTMLERHPNLPRVRVDLAMAYLQKGDKEAAKDELNKILAASPPPQIKTSVERVLASLEPRRRPVATAQTKEAAAQVEQQAAPSPFVSMLRINGGLQLDSNANAQPERRTHPAAVTSPTILDDHAYLASISLEPAFDLGEDGGWGVRGKLGYSRTDYANHGELNYGQTELSAGPEYFGELFRVAVPMGYVNRSFGHDSLSNSLFIAPEGTYRLNDRWDLNGGLRYEKETFAQSTSSGEDNNTITLNLGPAWKMTMEEDFLQVVSLSGSYSYHNANMGRFTYREMGIGPSYFAHYPSGLDTFLQARYQKRLYDGNVDVSALGGTVPRERDDDRVSLSALISKTFMDKYVLSGNYTYTDNTSNTSIYEYEKHLLGVNLGVNWSF